jgi:large subunit ribosomal protein L11
MKKNVQMIKKIQFPAMQAKPGPALASAGINMPDFCNQFNDKTKDRAGEIVPCVITIYEDKSFDFVLKTEPAANLIMKAANVKKGSGNAKTEKVGSITYDQAKEIAEKKMNDLNAHDLDAAAKIIAGTARNMGIEVEGLVIETKTQKEESEFVEYKHKAKDAIPEAGSEEAVATETTEE